MKTMRNLFLLCAGLSLYACSSDDEVTNQLPEGEGMVEVKIVNPLSRAVATGNSSNVSVADGDVTVTLYYKDGETIKQHGTVTINTSTGDVAKFWNVTNPYLVTASIHGGKAPATSAAVTESVVTFENYGGIETYQIAPNANVPAYGETKTITKTTNSEVNDGKTYQMYTADLTMQVPFARLEFTVKRSDAESGFTTLNLGGVYLDNLLATGGATTPTNYKHPADDNFEGFITTATGDDALSGLYDTPASDFAFTAANVIAPSESKVYAYNIFPAEGTTNMPVIKVWFKDATDDPSVLPYQYAIIDTYGTLTGFEAGKIYKINAAALTDTNILPTEDGADAAFGVNVTVTQASWTVETVDATWQ